MGKYSKGANFERDVIKHLEKKGLHCIRSAGSKGIVDIVAFNIVNDRPIGHSVFPNTNKSTLVYLIQCKYGNATMNKQDKKELIELANKYSFIPVYAHKRKNAKHLKMDILKKE